MNQDEILESVRKHLISLIMDTDKVSNAIEVISEVNQLVQVWAKETTEDMQRFSLDANPREIAKAISNKEIPPKFIGEKNDMVLRQEIFSLLNTKPMFREEDFTNELFQRVKQLQEVAPDKWESILTELKQKFSDIESAFDAWKTRNGAKVPTAEPSSTETKPQGEL